MKTKTKNNNRVFNDASETKQKRNEIKKINKLYKVMYARRVLT